MYVVICHSTPVALLMPRSAQGGQTNITGSIASGDETDLSFILGGGQDSDASTLNGTLDPSTFSPQMQSYQSNYNFEEVDGFPEEVLAPTIAPSVKVEEEVVKEASSAGGGSFGKRFLGAFGKKKSGKSTPPMSGLGQGSQLMPAAEQLLSSMPASIEVSPRGATRGAALADHDFA